MTKKKEKKLTADNFVKEYKELCNEYGLRINATPSLMARDDGTWSIVVKTSIGRMPANRNDTKLKKGQ